MAESLVDGIDLALLTALQADARAPIATLSEAAGVSRATAYARLAQMRENGVIHSLTVCVDPHRVGLSLAAVLLLKSMKDTWRPWSHFTSEFGKMPEVEFVADLAGEFDLMLLARFRDTEHLRSFIEIDLRKMTGIAGTRTLLVLNEMPQRSLLLPTARPVPRP